MEKRNLVVLASALVLALVAGTSGYFLLAEKPAPQMKSSYSSPHPDTPAAPTNGTQDNSQTTKEVAPAEDKWLLAHEDWAISKSSLTSGPAGWAIGFGPFYQPVRIPFPVTAAPLMDGASASMLSSSLGSRLAVSVVPVTPDNVVHLISVPSSHNNRLQHMLAVWTGQVWMPLATIEGHRSQRPLVIEPVSASAIFSEDVRSQRNIVSPQALGAYLVEIAALHPDFKSAVSSTDAKAQFTKMNWTSLPGQQSLDADFSIHSSAGSIEGQLGVDVKPLAAGVTILTLRYLRR